MRKTFLVRMLYIVWTICKPSVVYKQLVVTQYLLLYLPNTQTQNDDLPHTCTKIANLGWYRKLYSWSARIYAAISIILFLLSWSLGISFLSHHQDLTYKSDQTPQPIRDKALHRLLNENHSFNEFKWSFWSLFCTETESHCRILCFEIKVAILYLPKLLNELISTV